MEAHKGLAALVLAPAKGEPDGDEAEDDGLSMAMEDLISALKKGDAGMAAEAFRAAHEICQAYSEEEE